MLTQDDLQAIGKIFENKFDSRLSGIEKKLGSMDIKMNFLEKKIDSLDKKMNRRFSSVDKKLNMIVDYFDHQDIDIRKRLDRIELHIGLVS